jgi:hypothetical protein
VEHFWRRGTFLWNILGIVEHFLRDMLLRPSRNNRARPGRGTISTSWNNFVEQFAHRGTFFIQKKGLTLFFSPLFCAPFSWNNSRTVEQFAVPSAFF